MAATEERTQKTEEETLTETFLGTALSGPLGRQFFYELFEQAGMFSLMFDHDERRHTYQTGAYDLMKTTYMQVLHYFPAELKKMMEEADARSAARSAAERKRNQPEIDGPGEPDPDLFD